MPPKKAHITLGSGKTVVIWMLLMLFFIGQLLVYTWSRVQFINGGYDMTRLQEEFHRLNAEQKSLKVELARLKSPERITEIARDHLGLVMPTAQQMKLFE